MNKGTPGMTHGSPLSIASETALEYVKKHPEMSTRGLATILYRQNKSVYRDYEHARRVIRMHRGQSGEHDRQALIDRGFYTIPRGAAMPASEAEEWLPYIVPQQYKRTLVVADIHVPYHVEGAVMEAVRAGKENGVDSVILLGDIADCYAASKFSKDPRKRLLKPELEKANQFLDWLRGQLPKARALWKYGNHEARLDKYITDQAPALWEMDGLNIASQLHLLDRGIVIVADQRKIRYGKLWMMHGDEWRGGFTNPVNPARGAWLRTYASIVVAHLHQTSSHSEHSIAEDDFTSWSLGCLSELHPKYMRMNKWNWGFGIASKKENGNFEFENYKIIRLGGEYKSFRA